MKLGEAPPEHVQRAMARFRQALEQAGLVLISTDALKEIQVEHGPERGTYEQLSGGAFPVNRSAGEEVMALERGRLKPHEVRNPITDLAIAAAQLRPRDQRVSFAFDINMTAYTAWGAQEKDEHTAAFLEVLYAIGLGINWAMELKRSP